MRTKINRVCNFVGASLALIAAAITGAVAMNPCLARCILLSRVQLVKIEPEVYVEHGMTRNALAKLQADVEQARERVQAFLGGQLRAPVVLVGGLEVFRCYGPPSGEDLSMTHTSPVADYIVIGLSGENIDCLSHEMVHAELHRRLGILRYSQGAIPLWFEEGAAMYVDARPEFDESVYQQRTGGGVRAQALSAISRRADFYANDAYSAFLTSKHVFAKWFITAHREGLDELIARIRNGENFAKVLVDIGARSPKLQRP